MLYTACPLSSMVGMPAFGLAMTGMDTFSLMLRTTDTSWSGPTEQLIPTASAPAASRETEASIALPPLKILPSASTVMVHHDRKITYRTCSVDCGESFFDVDHGLCCDQVNACIGKDTNLFLVHIKSFCVGIITICSDKRTGSRDITGYVDTISGEFSGISDESTVDLLDTVCQSMFGKIHTVSAKSRSIDDLASSLDIGTLEILDDILMVNNPGLGTDAARPCRSPSDWNR